ncbi:transcription termination/antitermination NusG family protein [Candidatus Mesenet endosymbiont of Agriotes lineatus]|uniref:transcription termination/antitermination NusG family protein n=1 Tax=Candidatus Mesenet endosymbiont of Agriotes lineatus TaxID=3077948 RepID=UPI0030CFEEE3
MIYKSKECLEQERKVQIFFNTVDAVQDAEEKSLKGIIEVFKEMLAQGIDVNVRNGEGETPLIRIINFIPTSGDKEGQYHEMINLLLKNDELDINLKDNNGRTALDLAILYLFEKIVDLLLGHKSMAYDTLKRTIQSKVQSDFSEAMKEKIRNCKLYREGLEESLEKQEYEWYIIEVLPRNEERVCNFILDPARKLYPFFVKRALAPFVENATKKTFLYPRYVFIHMKLCDKSLKIIKSIEGVFRFLGGDKPRIVSNTEIDTMLNNLDRSELCNQSKQKYEIGEYVVITQGAFKGFCGELFCVNYDRGVAKVNIRVFKFCTSPVEVRLDQIERKD